MTQSQIPWARENGTKEKLFLNQTEYFLVKQRNLLSNSIRLKTNFLCIPIQFEMFERCVSAWPPVV